MQEYYPLNVQENVSVVIPKMQRSLESVASCFSGSAFPTTNLQIGMLCMRTDDDNTLYKLVSTNPITWQSVGQDSVTAEKWANPITLQLKGMATSDAVSLDGSKNIDINVTSIKATDIEDTFFTKLFKRFADKAFPVGFIWESTDATNPANILGVGTWESYGQGRVLIGAGQGSGLSNYTAGSTGGEEKHKLTTEELAAHGHGGNTNTTGNHNHMEFANQGVAFNNASANLTAGTYVAWQTNSSRGEAYAMLAASYGANVGSSSWSGNHSHTLTIQSTGGNVAHENRPPYIVVHRWRRIS